MSKNNTEKNNYFAQNSLLILHGYLAIFIIALTTFLVFKFYDYQPHAISEVRPYVLKNTINDTPSEVMVSREGKERMAFMLSVIITVSLIFLSLFLSQKLLDFYQKKNWKFFYSIFSAITSYLILIVFFSITFNKAYDFVRYQYPLDSWQKTELYSAGFTIIFAPLLACAIVLYGCFNQQRWKIFFAALAVILAIFITSYTLFNEESLASYSINFSPVIYPLIQLFLGKALLIDLKSLYGLHPYFLEPFLHLFGASIEVVNSLLAALLLISLLAIAFCFFSIIKNKLLALVGFGVLLYMQTFANDTWPHPSAVAFQYEPIRLFFPSLLLGFLCIYLKNPTVKKYFFALIFFSCATLWNLDTGLPTFLTMAIILGYEKWFVSNREKFNAKSIALHLIQNLGVLAVVWMGFFLMLKIRFGSWPDLALLTYGQKAAFNFGYAMLPIPRVGIWQIAVMIYVSGGLLMIHNFFTAKNSLQNNFILVLTVLGVGLFTYYIGRSHDSNILHCCYPAVILLTIFADKFCAGFCKADFVSSFPKPSADIVLRIFPLILLSYLFAAFFFNFFGYGPIADNFILKRYSEKPAQQAYWIQEAEFIKEQVGATDLPRDDLLLLEMNDQDYYFALALKARSPLDAANLRHMFYVEELNEIHRLITAREKNWVVLVESQFKEIPSSFSKSEWREIKVLLSENYKISAKLKISGQDEVVIYAKSNSKH